MAGVTKSPAARGPRSHFHRRVEIDLTPALMRRHSAVTRQRNRQSIFAQSANVQLHGTLDAAQRRVERLARRNAPGQVGYRSPPVTVRVLADVHQVPALPHGLSHSRTACRETDARFSRTTEALRPKLRVARPAPRQGAATSVMLPQP